MDVARVKRVIEFLQEVEGYDVRTTIAKSADEAVSGADILCTCTPSRRPVFKGTCLRPGIHINPIGSYAPDMRAIDSETVLRASRIITEYVDGLWAAAGDLLDPLNKGLIDKSKVDGVVGDVLAGTVPFRSNEEEITLYESISSAGLDLAIAVETYKQVAKLERITSTI